MVAKQMTDKQKQLYRLQGVMFVIAGLATMICVASLKMPTSPILFVLFLTGVFEVFAGYAMVKSKKLKLVSKLA